MSRRAVGTALLGALLLAGAARAQSLPAPPTRQSHPLRDDVGLLDAGAADEVRRVCRGLEQDTSAELGVLILGTTRGEEPRAFGLRVFNSWGVGKAGLQNGALLLFAMRDRRVELLVGPRYEALFTPAASRALLEEVVVPHMRAGQPARGVIAAARAVVERIHDFEAGRGGARPPVQVEAEEFGGGRSESARSAPVPAASEPVAPAPQSAPTASLQRLVPSARGLIRLGTFLVLVCWLGFFWWVLQLTFATGQLVTSKTTLYLLALLVPALVAAVLWMSARHVEDLQQVDWGLGGGGLGGGLLVLGVMSHMCPRCNRWMSITSRTLRHASYTSSGTGERTYHCAHCRYHKVTTYTIPRRTRSKSSSRSSYSSSSRSSSSRSSYSSSSRSSFGGGSSRGGGGGASW